MTQLATCSAVAPATPNQERILFGREVARRLGWQLKPDMVTLAIDVSGPLAVEKLGAAIQAAVDKHPCLRTRIVRNPELDEQDMLSAIEHFRRTGLPLRSPFLQVVSPRVAVQLNLVTLSAAGDRPMEIKDAIAREFATPFPEGSECPLRAQLVSVGEDTYFLLVTIDHLFADGWSLDVLFHDIVRSYPEPTTKAVRTAVQEIGAPGYHSYDGERADVHYWANHWSQFAADRLPTRAIPFAKLSPLKGEPVFGRVGSVLSGDAIVGVRSLCKRLRTTPYRLFLAAVLIVLQHYTKRKRLAVWTHCANRSYPGAHDVIGCLMNTHLMGFEFSPTLTGRELLPTVAAEHNPTLRHERLPLSRLWQELQAMPRFPDSGFLVDYVSIRPCTQVYQSDRGRVTFSRSQVGLTPNARAASLGVYVRDLGDSIVLQSDYSESWYERDGVSAMVDDVRSVVELLCQDESMTLFDLQQQLKRYSAPPQMSAAMSDFLLADHRRLGSLL